MHVSVTVDVGVILSGLIDLEFDDGHVVRLKQETSSFRTELAISGATLATLRPLLRLSCWELTGPHQRRRHLSVRPAVARASSRADRHRVRRVMMAGSDPPDTAAAGSLSLTDLFLAHVAIHPERDALQDA